MLELGRLRVNIKCEKAKEFSDKVIHELSRMKVSYSTQRDLSQEKLRANQAEANFQQLKIATHNQLVEIQR